MELKQLENKNASEQMRAVRGYAIISKGDVPKKVDENTFTIPSQNGNGEYTIKKGAKWKCTCPDHKERKMDCKHIHAVKFFLDFNNKVKIENKGIVGQRTLCMYCNSKDTIGYGKRKTESGQKQRYRCKKCKRFSYVWIIVKRKKQDIVIESKPLKGTTMILEWIKQKVMSIWEGTR